MNKILRFKKIVSIGFFAAFLAVFLSAGMAQASFWDWLNLNKTNNNSQQAASIANAETLSAPSNFTATTGACGSGSINLSWNKVGDANQYKVKKTDLSNIDRSISVGDTSSYTDSSVLNENVIFKYSVAACDGNNCSAYSDSVSVNSPSKCDNSSNSSSSSNSANLTAKTGSADNITSNSARLKGTINPQGENISVYFKYRKSLESSETTKITDWMSTGSISNDFAADIKISRLSSGTTYVYRFYAYNHTSEKTINGDLKSFKTLSASTGSSSSAKSSSSSVSTGSSSSSSSVQQYTLKVKISGRGKIIGGGINCNKLIDGSYSEGENWTCNVKVNKTSPAAQITLTTQTPSAQYEFGTWGEACRAAQRATSCTVIMSGNKTVSATFNKKAGSGEETAAVSVRKTGKGSGKVTSIKPTGGSMAGINCGNDCSENFKQYCDFEVEGNRRCGTVYFKATADKGSTFGGWGGDCLTFKNEKDQCYVILDGAKTINANFNEGSNNTEGKYYDLTVTVSEGGVVTSADNRINCGSGNSPCKHSYGKNGTVTLKATPSSGYVVGDYSGCSKSGSVRNGVLSCKVKMTQNRNVKIDFKSSGISSSSSSSKSSSSSSSLTFSTNLKVITNSATNVTSNSATLNGIVNPKDENVVYRFYYVKKGQPETQKTTSWSSAVSGSNDISATADISGLSSETTYNFAIHAYSYTSKKFTKIGGTKSFTTLGGSSSSSSSANITLKITLSGTGSVYRDGYGNLGCGTDQAPATNNVCTQTIKNDGKDHELTISSGSFKSWSGCDSVENITNKGSVCKFEANGDKNITVNFD